MIIQNVGEFHLSELLQHKHSLKKINFLNVAEVKGLELLNEFKLLRELSISSSFIENNKFDLSECKIDTLSISYCYFDINHCILPKGLLHFIFKSADVKDYSHYAHLGNLINLEYDTCVFSEVPSIIDVDHLKSIESISYLNCKGLSHINSILEIQKKVKVLIQKTPINIDISKINEQVEIEVGLINQIFVKDKNLHIT